MSASIPIQLGNAGFANFGFPKHPNDLLLASVIFHEMGSSLTLKLGYFLGQVKILLDSLVVRGYNRDVPQL